MNKDIMCVDFRRHRLLFRLQLWCQQGFDYDIPPILQEIVSLKMGCTNSVLCLV